MFKKQIDFFHEPLSNSRMELWAMIKTTIPEDDFWLSRWMETSRMTKPRAGYPRINQIHGIFCYNPLTHLMCEIRPFFKIKTVKSAAKNCPILWIILNFLLKPQNNSDQESFRFLPVTKNKPSTEWKKTSRKQRTRDSKRYLGIITFKFAALTASMFVWSTFNPPLLTWLTWSS